MDNNTFLSLQFIRNTLFALPGTSEKLCFDTPAFYVNKYILSRMKEDGESLVIYTEERDRWMKADPETFYITDHYLNYKFMLVKVATVDPKDLKELLRTAWKKRAPKKMVKEWEGNL